MRFTTLVGGLNDCLRPLRWPHIRHGELMKLFAAIILGLTFLQANAVADIKLKEGYVYTTLTDGRPIVLPKDAYEVLREYESLDNAARTRAFGSRADNLALQLREKGMELGHQWELKNHAAEIGQPYQEKPTRMRRLEKEVDSFATEFLAARKAVVVKSGRKASGKFGKAGIVGAAAVAGSIVIEAATSDGAKADELKTDRFQQDEANHEKREEVEIGVLGDQ